jgi:hypothetical protein
MIFNKTYLAILLSIFTITSCGGSDSGDSNAEVIDNNNTTIEEVSETSNDINETNAVGLFRQHISAVINSPIPTYNVAQIAIGNNFSNDQDIPCDLSGTMTKEIIFQRQPNSFFTYEDDEIQYSFDGCSNIESESINGTLSLRYDLYLNDNDISYSSISSDNYKLALTFDSIENNAFFSTKVNGYVDYNRYKEPGIDETSIYSNFTEDDDFSGYKELKQVTYKFVIDENLAQRHESISGEVHMNKTLNSGTFVTSEVLVRDIERYGYYSQGSIKLIYGNNYALLEFFSDDTARIDIYSEIENTLISSLIDIPQSDIFYRFN